MAPELLPIAVRLDAPEKRMDGLDRKIDDVDRRAEKRHDELMSALREVIDLNSNSAGDCTARDERIGAPIDVLRLTMQ